MSLIANSGLIRKAVFPAELLPMVVGALEPGPLPVRAADRDRGAGGRAASWAIRSAAISVVALPAVILLHLPMVAGLALGLVGAHRPFQGRARPAGQPADPALLPDADPVLARQHPPPPRSSGGRCGSTPSPPSSWPTRTCCSAAAFPEPLLWMQMAPGEPGRLVLRGGAVRAAARDAGGGRVIAEPGAPATAEPAEAIRVEGVSKLYRRTLPGDRLRTLKSALVGRSLASGLKPEESIAALETVDFAVHQGEAFGVIGGNGSGKSTLLKLVAGMLKPTTGRITVAGRVAALIELGAGFHPEISGRENVFINGAVLGLSRKQIERRYDGDRGVLRPRRLHGGAGQELLLGDVRAPGVRGGDQHRSRRAAGRRGARRGGRGLRPPLPAADRGVPRLRQDPAAGQPFARPRRRGSATACSGWRTAVSAWWGSPGG